MRAESAETKIAAESKLAEAKKLIEDAQNKFAEAAAKLHAAESLQLEANRYRSVAERKLQEVEAREDDLRRRIETFKSEYVFESSYSFFFSFWEFILHNYIFFSSKSKLCIFLYDCTAVVMKKRGRSVLRGNLYVKGRNLCNKSMIDYSRHKLC